MGSQMDTFEVALADTRQQPPGACCFSRTRNKAPNFWKVSARARNAGLSVAALALHTLQAGLARGRLTSAALAHVSLLGLFGARLAAFLHLRTQVRNIPLHLSCMTVARKR